MVFTDFSLKNLIKTIILNILLIILVLSLNLTFISAENININKKDDILILDKCSDLESNKHYILNKPILSRNSTCINILNKSNIVLDCKGKNIVGIGINKAILIKDSLNILVKNCKFQNFETAFYIENVKNSKFVNLFFRNVKNKIYLKNTENLVFKANLQKEDFILYGNNINNIYPFFDLYLFLERYKLQIFLIVLALSSLLLDIFYERKLNKYISREILYSFFYALMVILFSFIFFKDTKFESIFYFIAVVIAIFPYLYYLFRDYIIIKEYEEQFPNFIMDLAEVVKSGMPITKAIQFLSKNNYGLLSYLVNKLSAQLSWGISFEKAIDNFSKESKSSLIQRVMKGVIEAHKSGGDIINFLEALINDLMVLNHLKKERESMMYKKTMQFYVLYFFLILTIVGISKFVLPFVEEATTKSIKMASLGIKSAQVIQSNSKPINFDNIFFHLALIEAFFSSFIIGKLTSNSLKAGLKHLAILFPTTFILMKLAGF